MRRRTAPLSICLLAVPALTLAPGAEGEVGDTLSLEGFHGGEELDVTVTKVVDPARAENSFLGASAGHHLVAVQFRMKNTGSETYQDAPWYGAAVIDQNDQRFEGSPLQPTTAGAELPIDLRVRPGDTAVGYVTFEVEDGSRTVAVQYTMSHGLSDDVGEWKVPKKKPAKS